MFSLSAKDREPISDGGFFHHSDRGVQYVLIKYTERLAEAGLVPSVGSVGDSYDNALAETIDGFYKAEMIHGEGLGARSKSSNSRRSSGSIGSTIVACSLRSALWRRRKQRHAIKPALRS